LQEKESVKCKKGGLEPQKQRFGSTKVKVWHCESKGLTLRNINKNHPRRSMRMTKVGSMKKKKRDGMKRDKKSVKRKKERCKRGERGVRGYGRDAIAS